MQQPTKEDHSEPAPDSESAKKKKGRGRLAKGLYYGIPSLIMIAAVLYSVHGILRFRQALTARDGRVRYTADEPVAPRLLGPGGRWSFAGVDWDCFHASRSEAELQWNWPQRPTGDFHRRSPISPAEHRLLEMLRSEGFVRTAAEELGLYSMDSEAMKVRFFTVFDPETNRERILSGGVAILAAPDRWEALTLTMPRWDTKETATASFVSMPPWTAPLCRRLDEENKPVFEIHAVVEPYPDPAETPDDLYHRLKTHWEHDGWRECRPRSGNSFATWQRGERLIMVRLTGQKPEDVKIVLIDGSVKVGKPF